MGRGFAVRMKISSSRAPSSLVKAVSRAGFRTLLAMCDEERCEDAVLGVIGAGMDDLRGHRIFLAMPA